MSGVRSGIRISQPLGTAATEYIGMILHDLTKSYRHLVDIFEKLFGSNGLASTTFLVNFMNKHVNIYRFPTYILIIFQKTKRI